MWNKFNLIINKFIQHLYPNFLIIMATNTHSVLIKKDPPFVKCPWFYSLIWIYYHKIPNFNYNF